MKRYTIYRIQKGSLNPNQEFLVLMAEGFTSFSEAEEFLSEKVMINYLSILTMNTKYRKANQLKWICHCPFHIHAPVKPCLRCSWAGRPVTYCASPRYKLATR
jgi:hypothetical protein